MPGQAQKEAVSSGGIKLNIKAGPSIYTFPKGSNENTYVSERLKLTR